MISYFYLWFYADFFWILSIENQEKIWESGSFLSKKSGQNQVEVWEFNLSMSDPVFCPKNNTYIVIQMLP